MLFVSEGEPEEVEAVPDVGGIEIRVLRLKSRISRRLVKLASWVDLPEVKRQPPPEPAPGTYSTRPAERNIFVHDNNVQRGLLPMRGGKSVPSSFPHSINSLPSSERGPETLFRPMHLFSQAQKIVSLQKKVIGDAIKSRLPPIQIMRDVAPEKSITVTLPVQK
jgi:hypothetical protein